MDDSDCIFVFYRFHPFHALLCNLMFLMMLYHRELGAFKRNLGLSDGDLGVYVIVSLLSVI